MLDTHILADRVSRLLKTRYAATPSKDLPFDLAFTDVMNDCGVAGEARGTLKSEIGKILSSRPRKLKEKAAKLPGCQAQFSFGVAKATRAEVILTSPTGGEEFVFRRDKDGRVINTSFTGRGSTHVLVTRATEFATTIFADCDRALVQYSRVRVLEEDANHVLLIIGNTYEAYISRGRKAHTVAMTVSREGKEVPQKEVPSGLLREAKDIAKQYFKGVGTLPLSFE